ncbi:MAG: hypothetical protein OEU84_15435 [Xanthomonadales bacterium]|nr:hypothetical protein [Xanthomonadales bacterium]
MGFARSVVLGAALLFLEFSLTSSALANDERIDASDPTKIYTFLGGGLKYNDYSNGEYMWEARAIGNIGMGEHDMLLFEAGYGWHEGEQAPGKDTGLTNARLRWFHLYEMNYELDRGYRGFGLQVDAQLAGQIKGTDGQNQVLVGAMPVFAMGGNWNLYLMLMVANTWDKGWDHWNGIGPSVTAQFIYDNESWWPGAQLRIVPTYTYFVAGELEDEGSGNVELNLGGEFTPTVMWDVTLQKNFDVYLQSFRRGPKEELENDWNVFFNVTSYF